MIAHRGALNYRGPEARGMMLTGATGWATRAVEPCRTCDDRGWLPPLEPGRPIRRCSRCAGARGGGDVRETGVVERHVSPYQLMAVFGRSAWRKHRDLLR